MLTKEIRGVLDACSFRGRAAFVVAVAGSAVTDVVKGESADAAAAALEACWSWIEGEDVHAEQIYSHVALLTELEVQSKTPTESSALCAVATAVYYTAWTAYSAETIEGKTELSGVPNDMFDVTDEAIEEACEYAVETEKVRANALTTLATRVAAVSKTEPSEQTGAPIRRNEIL